MQNARKIARYENEKKDGGIPAEDRDAEAQNPPLLQRRKVDVKRGVV